MPESLYALALLACPVGMGAMMWMMSRGHRSEPGGDPEAKRAELAGLEAQIDQLRAEQADRGRTHAPGAKPTVRSTP